MRLVSSPSMEKGFDRGKKIESHYFLLNLQIFFMGLQIFLFQRLAGLRNAKAWKFKRALLHKEEPCRAKTL